MVTLAPKNVAVVGLGTAGAAAAIFLARQGHRVTIFERTPLSSLSGAGAGIGVQPIGLRVLERLGLLGDILEHGQRIDRLHAVTEKGRTVLDLAYADFRPELFGVGLHRDVLFQGLHRLAKAEVSIDFRYGVQVEKVEAAGVDGVTENAIVEQDGRRAGFDMVVVADGRQSVRAKTSATAFERWYDYGCLWAVLPDLDEAFTAEPELSQVLSAGSAREMLGFLPSGRTHDMSAAQPELVSLFWSLKMSSIDVVRSRGLKAWKSRVLELQPKAAALLEELRDFDQLIPAAYSDTWMPRLYHGDSCVFIGDCAHATSPQLGQGANLALVDAWVLSEAMSIAAGDCKTAVRIFDRERRWRLRFYQLNSRFLTPVFQSDSRAVGLLRDFAMGPLCRNPLTRMQMLTTLVGAQNNGIPWTTIPNDEFMFGRD